MNVCCMAGGHHRALTEHVNVFLHALLWTYRPPPVPIATAKWPKRAHSLLLQYMRYMLRYGLRIVSHMVVSHGK